MTRRSAPPPHPTPCPTLSLPGAKRSPPSPPPPPGIPRGESERAGIEAEAKPSRRFARHRAPGGFPSSNRRSAFFAFCSLRLSSCSQQLYLFPSLFIEIVNFNFLEHVVESFSSFFLFSLVCGGIESEVFFFKCKETFQYYLFAPLFQDEKSKCMIQTIFIVLRCNW